MWTAELFRNLKDYSLYQNVLRDNNYKIVYKAFCFENVLPIKRCYWRIIPG